ncbi:hypothetical protein, partial [Leptolyngbya sp. FACHB-541]|uniref:hypothetical protein n=1 Tax=Leptolyngbya sp. FACHB-541 TaxID=2692810 RepID=UPI001A7EAAF3
MSGKKCRHLNRDEVDIENQVQEFKLSHLTIDRFLRHNRLTYLTTNWFLRHNQFFLKWSENCSLHQEI